MASPPYGPPAAELLTPSADRADAPAAAGSRPRHPTRSAPAHPAPEYRRLARSTTSVHLSDGHPSRTTTAPNGGSARELAGRGCRPHCVITAKGHPRRRVCSVWGTVISTV